MGTLCVSCILRGSSILPDTRVHDHVAGGAMFFLGLERSGPQTHLNLEIWTRTVFLHGLLALADLLADTACQETSVGCYYLIIKLVLYGHNFPCTLLTCTRIVGKLLFLD